jgi:septin family protein
MALLFVQNWDIIKGKEDEYLRFISDIYIPETTSMGLISAGGYYVEVGIGPRIIAVQTTEDLNALSNIITKKQFKDLTHTLKSIIYNYRRYALESTGRTKHEKYVIQKGVWKFNQYYDIRPGMREKYSEFILREHIPTVNKIDYVEITGGWNVCFGGESEIIAEFTFKDPVDIGRLLNNEDFRKITLKLKNEYVMNYSSRILRCTERFDEHKWLRL